MRAVPPVPPCRPLARRTGGTRGLLVLAAALCASGCGGEAARRDAEEQLKRDQIAIRSAIEAYLREQRGINPAAMEIELSEVRVDGDRASAVATFRSAEAPGGIAVEYALERAGEGWAVRSSAPRGGHGAGGLPEGHPPTPPASGAPADAS